MGSCNSSPIVHDEKLLPAFQPHTGSRFEEQIYLLPNGVKRNLLSWTPKSKVKAVVFIAHGLHEHGLRYYKIAHALNDKGYAVYSIDHFGHGLSTTNDNRGLIIHYQRLYEDFVSFVTFILNKLKSHGQIVPSFIFCHSMGTLVTLLSVNRILESLKSTNQQSITQGKDKKDQPIPNPNLPFDIAAVIFSACPLFVGPAAGSPFGLSSLYWLSQTAFAPQLTQIMSTLDPRGPLAPINLSALTSDENELEIIPKDPRHFKGEIMNKTGHELQGMIQQVKKELPEFKRPFYCIHGSDDEVGLPKGSEYLAMNAGTDPLSKKLEFFEGLKHELFREKEPEGSKVIQKIVGYFELKYQQLMTPPPPPPPTPTFQQSSFEEGVKVKGFGINDDSEEEEEEEEEEKEIEEDEEEAEEEEVLQIQLVTETFNESSPSFSLKYLTL